MRWSIITRSRDFCIFLTIAALMRDEGLEVVKPVHSFFFWYRAVLGDKKQKESE
jgi:hypothetical protein